MDSHLGTRSLPSLASSPLHQFQSQECGVGSCFSWLGTQLPVRGPTSSLGKAQEAFLRKLFTSLAVSEGMLLWDFPSLLKSFKSSILYLRFVQG